jgi:starch phosphorylase
MQHFLPRSLPAGLDGLTELALDLRWTWSHAGDALWSRIDAGLWERTRNPWAILQYVPQRKLEALAADPLFQEELSRVLLERKRYQSDAGWYEQAHPQLRRAGIAYFSMEFGLSEAFPLYAGGLGVLAGDFLKTASDLAVPVVGVGLLYQEGYFRQIIDAAGRQREAYPYNDPSDLPVQPVISASGAWLRIGLGLPGRMLHLRVWQANVGRAAMYLLDSNDLLNGPADRAITAKLYGGGAETRLLQEMVLGIGGWRMLDALGIEADLCHLNEGHAAFAVLERARLFAAKTGSSFAQSWWATRAGNLFTTHTAVAAGIDAFPPQLIRHYFDAYARELGLPLSDLLALGRSRALDDAEPFNMAFLALRGCARANAVSRLHGAVSRRLFRGLYPRWPDREVPIGHVTNGVHVPSWDSLWADRVWTEACGKSRWLGAVEGLAESLRAIDDDTLWQAKVEERRDLVRYARERLGWQLAQRGAAPAELAGVSTVLNQSILILGFARRFADYKRPNLLLKDPDRLARLLLHPTRPVQIIVAGKAHPDAAAGKALVAEWLRFVNRPDVRAHAVFLEDYDMALARQLVQGVDVWINTPRQGWEACGTSGMKVLANGGLNLSALDGWWAEAYAPESGWAIGACADGDAGDDATDAEALYRLLETEIVPAFYRRDERGIPVDWVRRMRAGIAGLAPRFSSNRMLQDYAERLYRPALAAFRRRSDERGRLAKELHAWHTALARYWHDLRFGALGVEAHDERWQFELPVYLGRISPEWIKVELYADAAPDHPALCETMDRAAPLAGETNAYMFRASASAARPQWHYTPRIRAYHPEACTPAEAQLVLWQR